MNPRWILHLDMDSFYVAVERLKNPKLVAQPIVVGGSGPRSVVASASYEARKFGVHSAMPTTQARRLCPSLIIVPPSFADYAEISERVFREVKSLAPVFEKVSIDEAYLDLTGCDRIYPHRREFGRQLKELVFRTSKLACSVGIGSNKMIAKIATDEGKPNGLFEVVAGEEAAFLAPLPIEKIPGIGKKTAAHLHAKGILRCADLTGKSDSWIREQLGSWGFEWRERALGRSDSPVIEEWSRKSISAEETFPRNINDITILHKVLLDLAEDLSFDLRRENLRAKTIHIKIRYPDFTTHTRCQTLTEATDHTAAISEVALNLMKTHKNPQQPLRLLGLKLSGLSDAASESESRPPEPIQLDLFSPEPEREADRQKLAQALNEKRSKLESAKDALRSKFGKKVFLAQIDK
jgi:DNA polymerase-4